MVAVDEANKIIFDQRVILSVKKGTLGLRQSDAFFQHVKNLPDLYEALVKIVDPKRIRTVCVSDKPRQVEGSYMPVFTAGLHMAQIISSSLGCPLVRLSHQENHLYAVAHQYLLAKDFIGVHISGGTSEILKVSCQEGMTIDLIGHSLDLSFGKLIDRVGVYMGLDFPCGKALDDMQDMKQGYYKLKLSIKGLAFNISGFENKLKDFYDKDHNPAKVSNTLFYYLGQVLENILKKALSQYKLEMVVMSGGVSANATIGKHLKEVFGENIIIPPPKYATDHALGNAYYGNGGLCYET